jgi:thioredoxin 1
MEAETIKHSFNQAVMDSDLPVLAFFMSSKCSTCFALSLIITELAEEYDGRIKFVKLNVEDNLQSAELYGIKALPSVLLFDRSTLVQKSLGFHYKNALKAWLEDSMKSVDAIRRSY